MGRREEKRRRRGRRTRRAKGMELVWNAMICMEKSNHKPIFSFFDEFGSKRILLGILVVFSSFRLDLELFWFGFVVDLGLYGN